MLDNVTFVGRHFGMAAVKGTFGHGKYLGRTETEAQIVVEKEVVEFVRSYQILRLLAYLAVFIGRYEFGTDGRVDYVEQGFARSLVSFGHGDIVDEMADERLGHPCVYTIHRHVVAIVGSPAQGKFAKVASAYHETAHLVGVVHEYLRALACLTVLVGHVVNVKTMVDVLEMLRDARHNAYFNRRNPKRLHQRKGVAMGASCGAEARHGYADDALAVELQLVEGSYCYQKSQRGVESAAYSHHGLGGLGVAKTFGQSHGLYVQYLLTARLHVARFRNKGQRVYGSS